MKKIKYLRDYIELESNRLAQFIKTLINFPILQLCLQNKDNKGNNYLIKHNKNAFTLDTHNHKASMGISSLPPTIPPSKEKK